MNEFESYYDILEISKTANEQEVKKAFHRLASEYHPDKNNTATDRMKGLAEEKFKEINEAYSVLKDAVKRRQYDLKLKDFEEKQQRATRSSATNTSSTSTTGNSKKASAQPTQVTKNTGWAVFFVIFAFGLMVYAATSGDTDSVDSTVVTPSENSDIISDSVIDSSTIESESSVEEFPAGCSSSAGYSATSGLACDGSNTCASDMELTSDRNSCVPVAKNISLGSSVISQDNIEFSLSWSIIGQKITDYSAWGYSLYNKTTTGNFAVVDFKLNNTALTDSYASVKGFKLEDQAGRVYYPIAAIFCGDTTATSYPNSDFMILKPAIPCVSKLLFELSQDSNAISINFFYTK